MSAENFFVHSLLRAHDWQHRPQLDEVCQWWRGGGRGVLALVGMGGAGKTAIVERFLRVLPGGLPPDPDVPKDGTLPTPHGVFVFSFYDAPNPEAFFEALQMWLQHSPDVEKTLSLQQMIYLLQQTPGLMQMVLDGLEKVQEDGVRGLLGRLASPKLREFLDRIAAGYFPQLSVLVTSRFPLADLRDARPQFFRSLPIEEIEVPAGIRLLRARGVKGTNLQLEGIVEKCGQHALTVDFAGGYIAEFGGGDPATPVDFEMDSARLRQRLDDEPDEARRRVLKQGHRFARLAERYRDAMRGAAADRSDGDAAALALLERICLFRLGVDAETLGNIFTGEKAVKVSGPALAGLSGAQLQKKLDWLVRMRIVEASTKSSAQPHSPSDLKPETRNLKPFYSIHPAVRDGFLRGFGDEALRENHEAVRQGLEVSLGDAPGQTPSDPVTLDLMEEIIYHALECGRASDAWSVFQRLGPLENLIHRLGNYERCARICRLFLSFHLSLPDDAVVKKGDYEFARKQIENHSAHLQQLRTETIAELLNFNAICLSLVGDLRSAMVCQKWTVVLLPRSKTAWLSFASLLHDTGRLVAAEKAFRKALPFYDYSAKNGHLESSLASLLSDAGDAKQAAAFFQKAINAVNQVSKFYDYHISRVELPYVSFLQRLNRQTQVNAILNTIEAKGQCVNCEQALVKRYAYRSVHNKDFDAARHHASRLIDWCVEHETAKPFLLLARIERKEFESYRANLAIVWDERLDRAFGFLEEGISFNRSRGYTINHIDLLLERARLHLLSGAPQAALNDLRTALDDGVPGNPQTGQPELLAATHAECGYAWGIAEGLQLRGEALLLQAAQTHGQSTFVPAHRTTLPAAVRDLIAQAEACLTEALARWQPLHDPAPERPDQNFQLDGQQYNYRAAETHRILMELAGGVLTNYPLAKVPTATDAQPIHAPTNAKENAMSKRFAVALSFPGEHRDYVKQIADTLVTSLTKPRVFYDRYYEAELSRPNLDTYLQKIYHDESELVVVVLCKEYDEKEWCGLEFRAIRDLIKKRRDDEIMFVRVADGDVKGVFGIDGYVDAKNRPATEIAQVICDRLALLQSQTP